MGRATSTNVGARAVALERDPRYLLALPPRRPGRAAHAATVAAWPARGRRQRARVRLHHRRRRYPRRSATARYRMPSSFSVGLDVAVDEPVTFVAVTIASSVSPMSIPSSVNVAPVAPLMFVQVPSRHSCHWYLNRHRRRARPAAVADAEQLADFQQARDQGQRGVKRRDARDRRAHRAGRGGRARDVARLDDHVDVSPTYGASRLSTAAVASEMFLHASPAAYTAATDSCRRSAPCPTSCRWWRSTICLPATSQ